MKKETVQLVVLRNNSVLFKTEPIPTHACKTIYEELQDKFRISMYEVKILKKTTYQGYAELKNVIREDELF